MVSGTNSRIGADSHDSKNCVPRGADCEPCFRFFLLLHTQALINQRNEHASVLEIGLFWLATNFFDECESLSRASTER